MAVYKKKDPEELKKECPICKNFFIRVNGNNTYCSQECRNIAQMQKYNSKWLKQEEKPKEPGWKKIRNPNLFY